MTIEEFYAANAGTLGAIWLPSMPIDDLLELRVI
jgi:hypothetical protein